MKLIQVKTSTTTYWYESEEDITEGDIKAIKEDYDGDIESWLDDQENNDRYLRYENNLVREKDLGSEESYHFEDDSKNIIEIN